MPRKAGCTISARGKSPCSNCLNSFEMSLEKLYLLVTGLGSTKLVRQLQSPVETWTILLIGPSKGSELTNVISADILFIQTVCSYWSSRQHPYSNHDSLIWTLSPVACDSNHLWLCWEFSLATRFCSVNTQWNPALLESWSPRSSAPQVGASESASLLSEGYGLNMSHPLSQRAPARWTATC